MNKKEFCIFILTYGRPNNVRTIETLKKSGYKGEVFLVCSTDDKLIDEYKKLYKNVLEFNKDDYKTKYDLADNFDKGKDGVIFFARNACFDLAKKIGYKYFIQLDDDYNGFFYKFNHMKKVCAKKISNIQNIFCFMFDYYKAIPAVTISMSQLGEFLCGNNSNILSAIKIKRKAMNSFLCSTDRPFQFVGRINEDVNTYCESGKRGRLVLQLNTVALSQMQTQKNKGGMTEIYIDTGTYIKSFYSVIFCPSCVSIESMNRQERRLHHRINWKCAVPKIVSESLRK